MPEVVLFRMFCHSRNGNDVTVVIQALNEILLGYLHGIKPSEFSCGEKNRREAG